ncbi:DUF4142 domain-containing protein [Myroides sp. DW712]|uniref:DUF4142 domain-containing protein n=1 Tax=Myroides sp. DW712 TaxID=3389800 RepID=UPI00397C8933
MGVSVTYKLFVILFTVLFFVFFLFVSCKNKSNSEQYLYKEESVPKPVHTAPFSYDDQYDTTDQETLQKRFSDLLATQLYYTKIAITQSQQPQIQEFAERVLLEYEHALQEMESLISREKQEELLFRRGTKLLLPKLETPNLSTYDRDFLDETIKLQFSIREVLWYLKKSTKNADLQTFYSKLIQEIELRIDQGVNLLHDI